METKEKKKEGLSRLFEIAGQKKGLLFLAGLLSAGSAVCMLVPYWAVYEVLKELLTHGTSPASVDEAGMIRWGWIAFCGLIGGLVLLYAALMSSHVAAFRILYGLRVRLSEHIGKLSLGYLNNTSTGAIKKTMEQNIEKIEGFIAHTIPDLVNVVATVVVMLVIFFSLDTWLTAVCLAVVLLSFALQFSNFMGKKAREFMSIYYDAQEKMSASAVQYGGSRFLAGYPNDGLTVIDQDTLEAKVVMTQDFQKEFCKMLNKMWNLGIADPEMFMQTDEQLQSKIGSGRVAGMYDQRSMISVGLDALEANDPSRMLVAFPVTFEGVETERYRGARTFQPGFGIGISVTCEDPDRAFQFLDDLASEECHDVRAGHRGHRLVLRRGRQPGEDRGAVGAVQRRVLQAGAGHRADGLVLLLAGPGGLPGERHHRLPSNTPEYAQQAYEDYELEFLSHYDAQTFCDWFDPSYDAEYEPGWSIRQRIDTSDPRKIAGETALTITLEYIPQLTQCAPEDFETVWAEFVSKLDELPLDEYEELATQMIQEGAANYQN